MLCRQDDSTQSHSALGLSAGSAAVTLLERAPRDEHAGAAPAQRVASKRRGVAQQYDQRDLNIFAEVAGALRNGQRACTGDEFETIAPEQARHLLIALRTGEH